MERQYSVTAQGQHCGKVCVEQRGLYYYFSCRCILPKEGIRRLQVQCGEICKNLGVLLPLEDGFGLETRIPAKHLGTGALQFFVTDRSVLQQESARKPERPRRTEIFVPIRADEPFGYIAQLKESFLIRKDGQIGILTEKTQKC